MPNFDSIEAINQALDELERTRPSRSASLPHTSDRFDGHVVLVTGANRGLGLGIVAHCLCRGATVVAGCRTPEKADELNTLLAQHPDSFSIKLDLSDHQSIEVARAEVASKLGRVDILFNNAGISSPDHPNDPIVTASSEVITQVFQTNVIGTIVVTNTFLPLLRNSDQKIVVNMSSQLGSIECCFGIQGRYGGVSSYRIARAANNMAMRTFAGELRQEGFTFISMSPGHVATDMGSAGGRKAPLSVDQSVTGMLDTIAKLDVDDNGTFRQYDGATLPW